MTALPLMQLAGGFWSFKTLAGAVEIKLFDRLAGGRHLTVQELADELGFAHRPTDLLVMACASLGLLDKQGDAYANSALAEEFLVPDKPRYFGGFVCYLDQREYLAWHKLVTALRTNRPQSWNVDRQDNLFQAGDAVMEELFWEAMHSASMSTAHDLAAAYDFSPHKALLDIGGGSGAFPIVLTDHYPHLRAAVFDLPHVCPQTEAKIEKTGKKGSVTALPGDFRNDPALPGGFDVMLLSNILHDWDEPTGRKLLAHIHQALEPGGVLLIAELLINPERTGPPSAALVGLNMLVETEGGKNYSEAELAQWLTDTGFTRVRTIPFEAVGANAVIIAEH
ncbi:methyltransferase [Streptomyces xanthochromogenes]|uniref:methyltransferase n=1 Tax=Streptomyces xanthochromogenes TaxID=67384 RepID=UPI0037F8E196